MTMKTCPRGHRFNKSSDCPVCPICESEREPAASFMEGLAAPARRALEREQIFSLKDLSAYTRKDLLALHGFGKSSIPVLESALNAAGLDFKQDSK